MDNRICAGIVLFNPDISRLEQSIQMISLQVESLIFVDNSSDNLVEIKYLLFNNGNFTLLENPVNLGIARALNQICEWSLNNQYQWVLTLDQDSICPEGMIDHMKRFIEMKDVGMIGSKFLNVLSVSSNNYRKKIKDNEIEYVESCITSGSLMSLDAWKKSGKFDDWMFIDCVDYDICLKLRLSGYNILRDNSVVINHCVGNAKIIKLLGKNIIVYNHNAIRNYYFVRNYIFIIRKYKKNIRPFKRILYVINWEIKKILFEPNKRDTIKSAMSGFFDGLRCKL